MTDRQTKFYGNNSKSILMQGLWFLHSACRLMLIDIFMKLCEDSFNSFQVCDNIPREITQKV